MRARTRPSINAAQHCARTRTLRHRAQAAEARAEAAEEALAEARREMEHALEAERRAIRRERRDAIAAAESPDWQRDLLVLARDRVRAELLALATQHDSCAACGSFGRGFYGGLLQAEIDAVTAAHDLPPTQPLGAIDWPVAMGRRILKGRVLNRMWLEQAARAARRKVGPAGG